jgi:CDP-glycerol glycerophosphotransferase
VEVLRDCLDAMTAGLGVLDAARVPAALQERVLLILSMDVPRLVPIAESHPDPAYRKLLGAFTRDVWDRAESARTRLDPALRATIDAVSLW